MLILLSPLPSFPVPGENESELFRAFTIQTSDEGYRLIGLIYFSVAVCEEERIDRKTSSLLKFRFSAEGKPLAGHGMNEGELGGMEVEASGFPSIKLIARNGAI